MENTLLRHLITFSWGVDILEFQWCLALQLGINPVLPRCAYLYILSVFWLTASLFYCLIYAIPYCPTYIHFSLHPAHSSTPQELKPPNIITSSLFQSLFTDVWQWLSASHDIQLHSMFCLWGWGDTWHCNVPYFSSGCLFHVHHLCQLFIISILQCHYQFSNFLFFNLFSQSIFVNLHLVTDIFLLWSPQVPWCLAHFFWRNCLLLGYSPSINSLKPSMPANAIENSLHCWQSCSSHLPSPWIPFLASNTTLGSVLCTGYPLFL